MKEYFNPGIAGGKREVGARAERGEADSFCEFTGLHVSVKGKLR